MEANYKKECLTPLDTQRYCFFFIEFTVTMTRYDKLISYIEFKTLQAKFYVVRFIR
jgi:hypothetical protein